MPEFDLIKCKHCGGDIAVPKGRSKKSEYHSACAWYELPCSICGKPMRIHREWETPPNAHKSCKDAAKSKWQEKPCEYCGRMISFHVDAVLIPRFHKNCVAKAKKAGLIVVSSKTRHLRVFLCHSSDDKLMVRKLCERLASDGIQPWLDEIHLLPGQDWHHEITKAVRDSHAVIVCLSGSAVSKAGYVQKEIKYALDVADEQPEGSIFLIPLLLEECDIPNRLQRWQWVKFFAQDGYEKLLRGLRERARTLRLL